MKVDMWKCNLTGAAVQLLWDGPSCMSYEQLVLKLNQRFGEENQAECFRAKLKVRKQLKDESLSSLMQDVRMMILAYPDSSSELGEIMAKDCFLDALSHFCPNFFAILARIECSTCGTVGKNGLSTQFNLNTFFI